MKTDFKTDNNTIIMTIVMIVFILYVFGKMGKIFEGLGEGIGLSDSKETKKQKEVDTEELKKRVETSYWLEREKKLPANQKTRITNATAKSLALSLWERLRPENFQTMHNADSIYSILQRIGTEGGLYYVIHHYGVRNGKDLPTELRYTLGFDNRFSKDLDEVNKLYKKRGFKYVF